MTFGSPKCIAAALLERSRQPRKFAAALMPDVAARSNPLYLSEKCARVIALTVA
jgi:hypothetical protein